MNNEYVIIFIILIISSLILFFVHRSLMSRFEKLVYEHGSRIHTLRNLNDQYHFYDLQQCYSWCTYVNTRKKCENFDLDAYWESIIIDNYATISQLVETAHINSNLYKLYQEDIQKHIPSSSFESEAKEFCIPYQTYNMIENRLISAEMKHPICIPIFECRVIYDSPAGRSHLENARRYSTEQLIPIIHRAIENQQKRNSIEYKRKIERSKMNNSLRYDVLQRDGFRCRICGRTSNDGVKLHVDHIIPVAKGGKTELSNLRTLCDICNSGKRDKYDPYGVN